MPALSDELILLQEHLRERRRELEARLERVRAHRRRLRGPLDPDFAEQAVERENDEVLDGLDHIERAELERIEAALARVDAGCFGICDLCGEDVDPLRLGALPSTPTCLRCAETDEARAADAS